MIRHYKRVFLLYISSLVLVYVDNFYLHQDGRVYELNEISIIRERDLSMLMLCGNVNLTLALFDMTSNVLKCVSIRFSNAIVSNLIAT